jgi:hypothetical protein
MIRRKRKKIRNTDDVADVLRDDFKSNTKIKFEGEEDCTSQNSLKLRKIPSNASLESL